MSTEQRRILGMLTEGKISLEECEEMLEALPQKPKVETKPPVKKKSSGGLTTCLIVALVGGAVVILLILFVIGHLFLARPGATATPRIYINGHPVPLNPPERDRTHPLIPE